MLYASWTEKPMWSLPMKPALGVYWTAVRLLLMVAVPFVGGCVMFVMLTFCPSEVVSTGSVLVGGGVVLMAVTRVGQATAGVVKEMLSRKLPTVGLPPALLTAPNRKRLMNWPAGTMYVPL